MALRANQRGERRAIKTLQSIEDRDLGVPQKHLLIRSKAVPSPLHEHGQLKASSALG
jgi:hypothetical protein